jgi:hypothetical protein
MNFHILCSQFFCSPQFGKVDDEGGGHHFAAGFADEIDGSTRGSAGGNEIIDQQDAVVLLDGVGMNLDGIDAVFEGVFLADGT